MVIFGGYPFGGGETKEINEEKVAGDIAGTPSARAISTRPPLTFNEKDIVEGKLNMYIPLIIQAVMENSNVRRIQVD